MPDSPEMPLSFDRAFSLSGEVALITGGGTGLGFAMARAFVAAGATVVLVGRQQCILASASARLGPRCSFEVHDVTALNSAPGLVARTIERHGRLSILVNNAGIHLKKPLVDTSEAEFEGVLSTHVMGAFGLSRAVAGKMTAEGRGSILFLASMTSLIGMPNVVAYAAAKAAYLGMVRSLACELSPHGVRVNAIAPGWIETPMLHQALDDDTLRKARILQRTPMGRFGDPEDIGWAAVYLSSSASRFVTGVVLPVDGGASIGF